MRFTEKIVINGEIKSLTPLHIGGSEANFKTDMPVALNGEGLPYIPATSLAGVFRSFIRSLIADHKIINDYFGIQKKSLSIKSHIIINDAVLSSEAQFEIRDHNGIDRGTQTTVAHVKYDTEVIPAGSVFDFNMEIDCPEDKTAEFKEITALIIEGLTDNKIFIGGHTTRGLGRIVLESVQVKNYNFKNDRKKALDAYLDEKGETISYRDWNIGKLTRKEDYSYAYCSIQCKLASPFIVQSGAVNNESDIDIQPLLSVNADGHEVPVLPGSSLKGVFRTRADMITRTLKTEDIDSQLKQAADILIISDLEEYLRKNKFLVKLFGTSIDYKNKIKEWENHDCLKEPAQPARVFFEDAYLYTENQNEIPTHQSTHVKIDRFTGGAIEGALYDMETVWSETTDIFLDINILVKNPELRHIGLIAHCMKDLLTGDLKVGFGTRRGFGRLKFVKIKKCDINCGSVELNETNIFDSDNTLSDTAQQALNNISDAFNEWMRG